jgi:hypothetical protein
MKTLLSERFRAYPVIDRIRPARLADPQAARTGVRTDGLRLAGPGSSSGNGHPFGSARSGLLHDERGQGGLIGDPRAGVAHHEQPALTRRVLADSAKQMRHQFHQ